MFYTIKATPRMHQISMDEFMAMTAEDLNRKVYQREDFTLTRTTSEPKIDCDVYGTISLMTEFMAAHKNLYTAERSTLYRTFYIPKKSGGMRRIDAPNDDLKQALEDIAKIFKTQFSALYHTTAYAYVEKRSVVDALRIHTKHESRWFLKTDFSNFFGNTTKEFVIRMLTQIDPFQRVINADPDLFDRFIDLAFLNGGLPQGTPLSPMLTNLIMIPFDYYISNRLHERHLVYTRYADDCLISSKISFNFNEVIGIMKEIMRDLRMPYELKREKIRYGSSSGSNWNLGLMINKDNNITIGWKNRKRFCAACNNYCADKKNGILWDLESLYAFNGLIAWYSMVQEDDIEYILKKYTDEFGFEENIKQLVKADIKRLRGRL